MTNQRRRRFTSPFAITIFVLLVMSVSLFIRELVAPSTSSPEIIVTSTQPTPSPSTQPDCFEIRQEKWTLEEQERKRSEDTIAKIYALQREYIMASIRELSLQNKVSRNEVQIINDLYKHSQGDNLPLPAFVEEFQSGERIMKRLLEDRLISEYLPPEAQNLGLKLATEPVASMQLVVNHPECFEESELELVGTIINFRVKGKPHWVKKQQPSDLVRMLSDPGK